MSILTPAKIYNNARGVVYALKFITKEQRYINATHKKKKTPERK